MNKKETGIIREDAIGNVYRIPDGRDLVKFDRDCDQIDAAENIEDWISLSVKYNEYQI